MVCAWFFWWENRWNSNWFYSWLPHVSPKSVVGRSFCISFVILSESERRESSTLIRFTEIMPHPPIHSYFFLIPNYHPNICVKYTALLFFNEGRWIFLETASMRKIPFFQPHKLKTQLQNMYKSQEISYMYWDFVKIYYVGIRFK